MVELNRSLKLDYTYDLTELNNVLFQFKADKFKTKNCQNIIAFDTEASNGFMLKSGDVVGFDIDKYDNGIKKTHGQNPKSWDKTDTDIAYMLEIDSALPVGLVYAWSCAIEDGYGGIKIFVGRTEEDYQEFCEHLADEMKRQSVFGFTSVNRQAEIARAKHSKKNVKALIFVHNFGYDFEYLLNIYDREFGKSRKKSGSVFARKERKPIKAEITINHVNFEYRDSYVLSGKSLKNWAKDCPDCPISKLDGEEFDYLTIKTPYDQLTPYEWEYIVHDTAIMVYCIASERKEYFTLENIPLTSTGKVRRDLKANVASKRPDWSTTCNTITKNYTPDEYKIRMQYYTGGYTHACAVRVGKILEDTATAKAMCFDIASSYPSALCNGIYPVEPYAHCPITEFDKLARQNAEDPEYRWIAKLKFTKLRAAKHHTYLSHSKCIESINATIDNGRVWRADSVTVWLLDLDFSTFREAYVWDSIEVLDLEKAKADYLPKEYILQVLDYYGKKTQYKGLDGENGDPDMRSVYQSVKVKNNACYGVNVYKAIADQSYFDLGGWHTRKLDDGGDAMFYELLDEIDDKESFGFFDLGATCSAIARKRIWDMILHFDNKIWYIDTDSLKGLFTPEDVQFVDDYNDYIKDREDIVAHHYGFDPNLFEPQTKKGVKKRLGVFEREHPNDTIRLKTLGAKRYVTEITTPDGDTYYETTIAGLPKVAGKKIKSFDDFHDESFWTTKESHKTTSYYNDNQPTTYWTGRDGRKYVCNHKYGICLKPTTFDMSMPEEFISFINMLLTHKIDKNDPFMNDTPNCLI